MIVLPICVQCSKQCLNTIKLGNIRQLRIMQRIMQHIMKRIMRRIMQRIMQRIIQRIMQRIMQQQRQSEVNRVVCDQL